MWRNTGRVIRRYLSHRTSAAERYPEVAREIVLAKETAAERQKEEGKKTGRGHKKERSGSREPDLYHSADQLGAAVGVSGASWKRADRLEREVCSAKSRGTPSP